MTGTVTRRVVVRAAVWTGLAVSAACKRKAEPPPAEARTLPPVEITREGSWLYTYVTETGTFETVDAASAVPEAARRIARVIDPKRPASERAESEQVYVVDVAEVLRAGAAKARVVPRDVFESSALAQLPPGASSDRTQPPPPADDAGAEADVDVGPLAPGQPVVIVYGTSWCPACRDARRYLVARRIPHLDKDIERDPAAARELAEKGARLGVPTDRIPILDVRGRLLVGFDRARVEALLGDSI